MAEHEPPRQVSVEPVHGERDPGMWEDIGISGATEVRRWRQMGFIAEQALQWVEVVRTQFRERGSSSSRGGPGEAVQVPAALAGAWTVGDFDWREAEEWGRALSRTPVADLVLTASEWREAGFTPTTAMRWASDENLETAVPLENGGWTPAERDLLDAWLRFRQRSEDRIPLIESSVAPWHVLDYVRAGCAVVDIAYYERLRRAGYDTTAQLKAAAAASRSPDAATATVIDGLIARLDGNGRGLHAEFFTQSPPMPAVLPRHEPQAPLPADFAPPPVTGTVSAGGGTWRRGYGDWDGLWPPEDSALEPALDWTDIHRITVLAAFRAFWFDTLDDNEMVDISWPPEASLWTEGSARAAEPVPCPVHDDESNSTCEQCADRVLGPDEITPAEWHWYVHVETLESTGDNSWSQTNSFHDHILTTYVDPRQVDYQE